eukprot:170669-Rhodomonas_salina.2
MCLCVTCCARPAPRAARAGRTGRGYPASLCNVPRQLLEPGLVCRKQILPVARRAARCAVLGAHRRGGLVQQGWLPREVRELATGQGGDRPVCVHASSVPRVVFVAHSVGARLGLIRNEAIVRPEVAIPVPVFVRVHVGRDVRVARELGGATWMRFWQ